MSLLERHDRRNATCIRALWTEERSLLDLVDADFTYVNGRLAQHYDFDGIEGDEYQRIQLPRGNRLGLLTQAGWLAAT